MSDKPMTASAQLTHKKDWRLNEVTDELNARPFPRFGLPTNIFRLCAAGPGAFASIQATLSELLPDVDWDTAEQGKLIRGTLGDLRVNIERHTEFVSVTIIDAGGGADGSGQSAAKHLPEDWAQRLSADIVVAVDCLCRPRGAGTEGWTCASQLEGGLASAFFDFKVAEDGHTKIYLEFDAQTDVRDIGRVALQVLEIETYRSFAALGLPDARAAQTELIGIAERIPQTPIGFDDPALAEERFGALSTLAAELEEIWRATSFRFSACQAYWALVQARLTSLQESPLDSRLTVGAFLERRLRPAVATYQSTERQRHDLAEQVGNMATFLQTRIELGLQRQNAELLASLNRGTERQLRLQRTVEGVSVVAISYYTVNLSLYPAAWLVDRFPVIDPTMVRAALVATIVP
ncbi:MAG TPA: hypothetical protein DIT66_07255, partial [Rhodobiaceae bacterium]|nr:hypothetical protein [Rhodobiaceae bacterium]